MVTELSGRGGWRDGQTEMPRSGVLGTLLLASTPPERVWTPGRSQPWEGAHQGGFHSLVGRQTRTPNLIDTQIDALLLCWGSDPYKNKIMQVNHGALPGGSYTFYVQVLSHFFRARTLCSLPVSLVP